jgi:hypothetical protein
MHRGLNCDLKAYHTKYEEFFKVQGLREGTPIGSPEKRELNCRHEILQSVHAEGAAIRGSSAIQKKLKGLPASQILSKEMLLYC